MDIALDGSLGLMSVILSGATFCIARSTLTWESDVPVISHSLLAQPFKRGPPPGLTQPIDPRVHLFHHLPLNLRSSIVEVWVEATRPVRFP